MQAAPTLEQLQQLPPERLAVLQRLLTPKLTKYIPHTPFPQQQAFLLLDCFEALYGGAAAGGKSDAVLMAALQYVDVPGYSAILFRQTYGELAMDGAIMDRARKWLEPTDAHWDGLNKRWLFPAGATLSFGYLNGGEDRFRYKSAEFQCAGFDELTGFVEQDYRYLASRIRKPAGMPVPLRMRGATNPDGPGHAWVKRRFLVEGAKHRRVFIPSRLSDNPHVDQQAYRQSLAVLDPVARAQLEEGRWDVVEAGPMFNRDWFDVVDSAPGLGPRVRYWDLAATKQPPGQTAKPWTAGGLFELHNGELWVCDMARTQDAPGPVEDLVLRKAEEDGREVAIRMEQEPGSAGVNNIDHYGRLLAGWDFQGDKKTGDKVAMARPVSSLAQRRKVHLVRGEWNTAYLDELHAFPNRGFAKDQVDVTSGALRHLTGGGISEEEVFRLQASW